MNSADLLTLRNAMIRSRKATRNMSAWASVTIALSLSVIASAASGVAVAVWLSMFMASLAAAFTLNAIYEAETWRRRYLETLRSIDDAEWSAERAYDCGVHDECA